MHICRKRGRPGAGRSMKRISIKTYGRLPGLDQRLFRGGEGASGAGGDNNNEGVVRWESFASPTGRASSAGRAAPAESRRRRSRPAGFGSRRAWERPHTPQRGASASTLGARRAHEDTPSAHAKLRDGGPCVVRDGEGCMEGRGGVCGHVTTNTIQRVWGARGRHGGRVGYICVCVMGACVRACLRRLGTKGQGSGGGAAHARACT
ncbi:hypothetical protein BC834DRAFT_555566 [Gloeopeniophorella convolvens]|nr:hypothetical protein BC834DRAFT_555566 [Gloeopeniophorella convolvens]